MSSEAIVTRHISPLSEKSGRGGQNETLVVFMSGTAGKKQVMQYSENDGWLCRSNMVSFKQFDRVEDGLPTQSGFEPLWSD